MPTKILVADDNRAILQALRLTLSEHSDWVICGQAADGLEAVSKAAELVPDIIILDLTMPKMNGLQAGSAIHTAAPNIPLLLFTQHNIDAALEYEARKAGFSGAITKGLRDSLITGIEALIRGEFFFLTSGAAQVVDSKIEDIPLTSTNEEPTEEAN
jgi:DNA-binding NarL/FixJ family response regulator